MRRIDRLLLGLICALLVTQSGHRRTNGDAPPVHIVLSMPAPARPAFPSPEPADGPRQRNGEATAAGDDGTKVTVRVQDEAGIARAGAKVYLNGFYRGLTDDAGILAVERVRIGDQLAALHLVHERPAPKSRHSLGGSTNWAWHVYQSNVHIAADGLPQLYEVHGTRDVQELVVRRDQPLVGFHVVVCVEWDAETSYLSDLSRGLEKASALLYDVSDGQLFWEMIEIADNCTDLTACDVRILASNQQWPRGHVGGITKGKSSHIALGRHFNGGGSSSGSWTEKSAFRALVHEFGHYGLGLWDEYPKAQGRGSAPNPADVYPAEGDICDSIMNDPYGATGLCSRADPNFEKGLRSQHGAKTHGELTWETVLRRFSDNGNPRRWILRSPVERGGTLPGPTDIPVSDWVQVHLTDQDSDACPSFGIQAIDACTGAPVGELDVQVRSSSPTRPDLFEGMTDGSGQILIYGAHPGDDIRVTKGASSARITVACSETRAWSQAAMTETEP